MVQRTPRSLFSKFAEKNCGKTINCLGVNINEAMSYGYNCLLNFHGIYMTRNPLQAMLPHQKDAKYHH
eukprot:scaffold10184_cov52-Cyclotella_meneghiniana.AAC.3